MDSESGNREKILSLSTRLFAERGYEAVGVAELCESAELSKPTLYHYFGSKRGLLDAIVAQKGNPLLTGIGEAIGSESPYEVKAVLEKVAFLFADSALEDQDFTRLRLTLAFSPPASEGGQAIAGFARELQRLVENYFTSAAGFHGNMKGRSLPYAAAFIGTMDSCLGLYLGGRGSLDRSVLETSVRHFMHGIFS